MALLKRPSIVPTLLSTAIPPMVKTRVLSVPSEFQLDLSLHVVQHLPRSGTFLTQIMGKSGGYIDQLQFVCSDNSLSQIFGGPGGYTFALDRIEGGLKRVRVTTDFVVFSLGYGFWTRGQPQRGYEQLIVGNDKCPMVGVRMFTDQYVNAIGFCSSCNH